MKTLSDNVVTKEDLLVLTAEVAKQAKLQIEETNRVRMLTALFFLANLAFTAALRFLP